LTPALAGRHEPSLLHSSGMHGGYLGIRRARPFLQRQILGTRGALDALEQMQTPEVPCVRIGVHVRGGDFSERPNPVTPGTFNEQLPLEWYVSTVQSLAANLDLEAQVFLATDSPSAALNEALTLNGTKPTSLASNSVGDLAMLSKCDIIVSSVSSFSMLAIFLSDSPYVWHKDQLGESGGWLSIWGHEPQNAGGGPTWDAIQAQVTSGTRVRRGVPQGNQPVWSRKLLTQLEHRALSRQWSDDLLFYGVTGPEARS
jgi:hypothetical protein